jgi:plastocyanin
MLTLVSVCSILAIALVVLSAAPGPAPKVDRVGFPEGYQTNFKVFYVFDRADNKQVRMIYANDRAAQVKPGELFPYGSILVMETYSTKKDSAGNVLKDGSGRYMRDQLGGIFVMRKEMGFGADYQEQRNGEWEYVAFRPDKTYLAPPDRTNACATCHMEAGPGKDWVFRANLAFGGEAAAMAPELPPNELNVFNYQFLPEATSIKVGTTLTWVNTDVLLHTVTATDLSFNSGALRPKGSFSRKFDKAGTLDYFCAIHPAMRAKVEVKE